MLIPIFISKYRGPEGPPLRALEQRILYPRPRAISGARAPKTNQSFENSLRVKLLLFFKSNYLLDIELVLINIILLFVLKINILLNC